MTPPLHRRSLTAESWDALFDFLDPSRPKRRGRDRDAEAEGRFLEITRKLVYFFAGRGCRDSEDLAAETMLRVAGKCAALAGAGFSDPIAYVYGVARNVLHEWLREARTELTSRGSALKDPTLLSASDTEHRRNEEEHQCLETCMARLATGARRLILNYYGADKAAKITCHRELAEQFGKSLNALRIEVHRIRNTLRRCVLECMQHEVAGTAR